MLIIELYPRFADTQNNLYLHTDKTYYTVEKSHQ